MAVRRAKEWTFPRARHAGNFRLRRELPSSHAGGDAAEAQSIERYLGQSRTLTSSPTVLELVAKT
jgi:hypothetical protein